MGCSRSGVFWLLSRRAKETKSAVSGATDGVANVAEGMFHYPSLVEWYCDNVSYYPRDQFQILAHNLG